MTARTLFSVATAIFCATAWAADTTPMNVKTGQWEGTSTSGATTGQLPIPQEQLDKLTPEMRAKLEAAMKATGGRTNVQQYCVRKEDLENPFGKEGQLKSCKQTIVASSAAKLEVHFDCDNGGEKQTGTVKFEAVDSGNVTGSTQMTLSSGGRAMNTNSTFSAKWVGPVCSAKK